MSETRWKIEKVGENYKLSFPESENWACDGEWLTPYEVAYLVLDLVECSCCECCGCDCEPEPPFIGPQTLGEYQRTELMKAVWGPTILQSLKTTMLFDGSTSYE